MKSMGTHWHVLYMHHAASVNRTYCAPLYNLIYADSSVSSLQTAKSASRPCWFAKSKAKTMSCHSQTPRPIAWMRPKPQLKQDLSKLLHNTYLDHINVIADRKIGSNDMLLMDMGAQGHCTCLWGHVVSTNSRPWGEAVISSVYTPSLHTAKRLYCRQTDWQQWHVAVGHGRWVLLLWQQHDLQLPC